MTDMASAPDDPTVILVHRTFADASGWAGVIERLTDVGVPARAVVNPLNGVSADSAYVAALAPDKGENLAEIEGRSQDSVLAPAWKKLSGRAVVATEVILKAAQTVG